MLDSHNSDCCFSARPRQLAETTRQIERTVQVMCGSHGRLASQAATTTLCDADPRLDVAWFRRRTDATLVGLTRCRRRLRYVEAHIEQSKTQAESADAAERDLSAGQTLVWWAGHRAAYSAQRTTRGAVALAGLLGDLNFDRGRPGNEGGAFTTRTVGRWAPSTGREVVAQALTLTGDGESLGPDEFAVVVHQPDSVYSVILPGVADLTRPGEGLDPHHRSVRDLDMAAVPSAAVSGEIDPYASMVATALEQLEIPPGAELNIIGHSYGAATAMTLAADQSFNRRFNVRSVVAAGYYIKNDGTGGQDTTVVVLENRNDLVVTAERLVLAPINGRSDNRSRVLRFNGSLRGLGHDPVNYSTFVQQSDSEPLEVLSRQLEAEGFSQGGSVLAVDVSVPVDDPTWLASDVDQPSRPGAWRAPE